MVRSLLGDVVAFGTIRVIPVAREDFAEDWIEWLLDSPANRSGLGLVSTDGHLRWLDVPSTEIEFGDCDKSLDWVVDCRRIQQQIRMCHEAIPWSAHLLHCLLVECAILGDSFQHRARLEDKGGQGDSAQVGSWS